MKTKNIMSAIYKLNSYCDEIDAEIRKQKTKLLNRLKVNTTVKLKLIMQNELRSVTKQL